MNVRVFLIFSLFLTGIFHGNGQTKSDDRIQLLLAKGKFKDASKEIKSYQKRAKSNTILLAKSYLYQAELYASLGDFNRIGPLVNFANEAADSDSLKFCFLMQGAEVFIKADLLTQASEQVLQAQKIAQEPKASLWYPHYALTCFELYRIKGYPQQALPYLAPALSKGLSVKEIKKTNVLDKGKTKTRKLSKWELAQNKRLLGKAWLSQIKWQSEIGAYDSAERLLKLYEKDIKRLNGSKDMLWLEYQFIQAQIQAERHQFEPAIARMEHLIKSCKGSGSVVNYARSAPRVFDWIDYTLDLHLATQNEEAAFKENSRFLKYARIYTKKNPLVMERSAFATAKINSARSAVQTAEKTLTQRKETDQVLPKVHPLRIEQQLAIAGLSALRNDIPAMLEAENKAYTISQQLYGDSSIHTLKLRVLMMEEELEGVHDFNPLMMELTSKIGPIIKFNLQPGHPLFQQVLSLESQFAVLKDDFATALDLGIQAKNNAQATFSENSMPYAMQLSYFAGLLTKQGKYAEADQAYEQALEITKYLQGTRSRIYAYMLNDYARLYITQAKYREAEKLLSRAAYLDRKATRNVKKEDLQATADATAEILMRQGQYSEAERFVRGTLNFQESKYGNKHRVLLPSLRQLAELYLITGKYTEAAEVLQKAMGITEQVYGSASLTMSKLEAMQASVLFAMGDFKQAIELQRKTIQYDEKVLGAEHIELASASNALAMSLFATGPQAYAEAGIYFNKALDISRKALGDRHPLTADYAKNLAFFFIETKNYAKAYALIEAAEGIYIDIFGKKSIKLAEIKSLEGDILMVQGEYRKAGDKYNAALLFIQETFGPDHPEIVKVQGKMARMHNRAGNQTEALRLLKITTGKYLSYTSQFFPILSERQKNSFWSSVKPDFDLFTHIAVNRVVEQPALAGDLYNQILNTKAILLGSSLRIREAILQSKDSTLVDVFDQWVVARELLASVLATDPEELQLQGISKSGLEKQIEELEKKLSGASADFAGNMGSKPITWQEVQKKLQPEEIAVEILRYRHYNNGFTDSVLYAVLLLSPSSTIPEMVLLPNGNELEGKYYKYFRNSLRFGTPDRLSFAQFWAPFKSKIPDGKRIIFSPDGIYNQMNPLVFRNNDDQYVLDQNEVVLVSNTKDLLQRKVQSTTAWSNVNPLLALMGNPEYYEDLNPEDLEPESRLESLTGAEEEIYAIRKIFKDRADWQSMVLLNEQVTEDTLKAVLSPTILHVATHGFFLDSKEEEKSNLLEIARNPLLKSGLLLSGSGDFFSPNIYELNRKSGILTAYEVMSLNYTQTELVVLSACETGLGEVVTGEGVFGLQRAFLVAGAEALVMSLFKVSDETTQELMILFYTSLIETGDKRAAFYHAMRTMKAKYEQPIHWGAFIMVGGL